MTLDGAGQLGGNNEARGEALPARHRPRLSPPGCAMLALLLRFPQARARAIPPRCTPPAHRQMPGNQNPADAPTCALITSGLMRSTAHRVRRGATCAGRQPEVCKGGGVAVGGGRGGGRPGPRRHPRARGGSVLGRHQSRILMQPAAPVQHAWPLPCGRHRLADCLDARTVVQRLGQGSCCVKALWPQYSGSSHL